MSRMNGTGSVGGTAGVDPARPLDTALSVMIDDARRMGRGFAVTVGQDIKDGEKSLTYKVDHVLPPADEYEPPVAYRAHAIEDAESFVTFAARYGDKAKSLVVFNDADVVLTINEQPERGQREKVRLHFAYSADWNAWAPKLTGAKLNHRDLLTFLVLQQHNLTEPTLLDSMRSIKATAQVKLDSDIRLEKEEVGVVFTATAGDDLVKFPRAFTIQVPVLDKDTDDLNTWDDIEVRVEVTLPTEPKQPVMFQLLAPTLNAIRRTRINQEVQIIRDGLPEWTVVRGTHGEIARDLGRD